MRVLLRTKDPRVSKKPRSLSKLYIFLSLGSKLQSTTFIPTKHSMFSTSRQCMDLETALTSEMITIYLF